MVCRSLRPNRGALRRSFPCVFDPRRSPFRAMRHSPHQLISGGGKPPYQGPSCNSEGAGSKEDGTHLLRGVLQPCDEPVTHPPWIGLFLSSFVFRYRVTLSK